VLQRFILVSKVVLNQTESILEKLRDAFIKAVGESKDSRLAMHLDKYFETSGDNEVLTQSILAMATETKKIFLEVYETFLQGTLPGNDSSRLNLTSLRHCLKRIFKASQI